MESAVKKTIRIPVKIADCFLLSLDAFMQKTGQGAHFSQSVIELSSCPDLCLGRPPGTGVFFNERNDKLTLTISWREGCLREEERKLMTARLLEDLLGRKQTERDDAM